MIGLSIVALTVLLNAPNVPVPTATVTAAHSAAWAFPSVKMPHIPIPKLRMPKLPKRNTADAPLDVVSRRLKVLVGQQESWYADHGSYGTQPGKMRRATDSSVAGADLVQVQVLYAGKKGWTAIASHPDAPGKNCVVYVGVRNSLPLVPRTRANATDASSEALPACDR